MGRLIFHVLIGAVGLALLAGCDKSPSEGVPLGAAPVASSELPTGHPPIGNAPAAEGQSLEGTIAETMDVSGYTYLHLDTSSGKVWAAVPRSAVKVGDRVTVERAMVMKNFESPSLKRTFEVIYFGTLGGGAAPNPHGSGMMMGGAEPAGSALPVPEQIKVDKATGPNAHTVSEVFAKAGELTGKQVTVQGVVVKVNKQIMGRNWVHLRDGTGSEAKKDHDLVITSTEVPQMGATVVMTGTVATKKDFGSGYSYDVLVEEATFAAGGGK